MLFDALRHKYPDMSLLDIVVCREIFVNNRLDEHPAHYDEIVARLLNERLEGLPLDAWPEFVFEAREYAGFTCIDSLGHATSMIELGLEEKGLERMVKFKLFRMEKDVYRAVDKAHRKGFFEYKLSIWGIAERPGDCKEYIRFPTVDVKLRDDIFDVLEKARLAEYTRYGQQFDSAVEDLLLENKEEETYRDELLYD